MLCIRVRPCPLSEGAGRALQPAEVIEGALVEKVRALPPHPALPRRADLNSWLARWFDLVCGRAGE
jgi:hypothetical protein